MSSSEKPALPSHEACLRQVHLDFHTSPYIPDVGSEFDPEAFAQTVKDANINSITIFSKCHHGMSYYPTKVGTQHPALKGRDLMGEQIEALHRKGIRCPLYTTVVWEEDVAKRFPHWLQLNEQGFMLPSTQPNADGSNNVGMWKYLDYLNTEYQDYIEAHVRELYANYDVDGLFFDILFFHRNGWWGPGSMKFRREHGFTASDDTTWQRFETAAQLSFMKRFTALNDSLSPKSTIFYNAINNGFIDSEVGPRPRSVLQTQQEIESLPSGEWGYFHFPRMARMQGNWGRPWLGMTGRFQKAWGDFGGIKPQAALEYECFRSQALGGGNSVGDQLPPRGRPDEAAYKLIGAVYEQVAAAEPFYENSVGLPQLGILCASYPGKNHGKSEEGVVQMAEESHYDAIVFDDQDDLSGVPLLVLPDSVIITPRLKTSLEAYYRNGGKLIISGRAGFDIDGKWALDFLPLSFEGAVEKYPTYWRARGGKAQELLGSGDRVVYAQGMNVVAGKGTEVWIDRVLPYFKRNAVTFSSHLHTPPVVGVDSFPAVVAGERFVYFADPIFEEYRQSGNFMVRDVWLEAVRRLIGSPLAGEGLPRTVLVYPRRRGNDLLLTLLHYVPVRKALDIDMVEEASSFAGEVLQLPAAAKEVRCYGAAECARLPQTLKSLGEGRFELPAVKGRLLLEVPAFFA